MRIQLHKLFIVYEMSGETKAMMRTGGSEC